MAAGIEAKSNKCLTISSKENPLFKRIKKLKERKYREQEMLFIAEGEKFLGFGILPQYIIINDEKKNKYNKYLDKSYCILLPEYLYNDISGLENPEGILGVFKINETSEPQGDIIILDKIQDPGNMGTIIRIADAAGYKNIVLIKGCVDPYNDKSIRGSMGSIFNVNIFNVSEQEMLEFLKLSGYNILVTTLADDSIDYSNMTLVKEKNAFVLGSEGHGVSEKFIECSSQKIKIPIYGAAESLNVGVAAGIILYKAREINIK